ncbi:hypothetical protein [Bacillus sp. JJ722]|uniref:hypothetical protein n=1 Tax=Bacillus sp. JJ722 TaxID=3122973 RepID=UPI002FFF2898
MGKETEAKGIFLTSEFVEHISAFKKFVPSLRYFYLINGQVNKSWLIDMAEYCKVASEDEPSVILSESDLLAIH